MYFMKYSSAGVTKMQTFKFSHFYKGLTYKKDTVKIMFRGRYLVLQVLFNNGPHSTICFLNIVAPTQETSFTFTGNALKTAVSYNKKLFEVLLPIDVYRNSQLQRSSEPSVFYKLLIQFFIVSYDQMK